MSYWKLLVLLALLSVIAYCIYYLHLKESEKNAENKLFNNKVEDLLNLKLDLKTTEIYLAKKAEIFQALRSNGYDWDESRLESDNFNDPAESWMRQLPSNHIATLKAALIKRTLSILPVATAFQQESQARFILYQKGLIDENTWNNITKLRDQINQATTEIRHDAESLQPGYGFSSQIFKEAAKFHEHEMQKRVAELQKTLQAEIAAPPPPEPIPEKESSEEKARLRAMGAALISGGTASKRRNSNQKK